MSFRTVQSCDLRQDPGASDGSARARGWRQRALRGTALASLLGSTLVVACVSDDNASTPATDGGPGLPLPDGSINGFDATSPSGNDASTGSDSSLPPNDASPSPDAGADTSAPPRDAGDAGPGAVFPFVVETPAFAGAIPNSDCTFSPGVTSQRDLSDDGRYVAFYSAATNLLTGGDAAAPSSPRYFVRDTVASTTEQVSLLPDSGDLTMTLPSGAAMAMSGNGRYVAFTILANSWNAALPEQFVMLVRDRTQQTTSLVGETDAGTLYGGTSLDLSSDGRYVAFIGSSNIQSLPDTVGGTQVWVRDLTGNGDAVKLASVVGGAYDGGAEGGAPFGLSAGVGNLFNTVSMSSDGSVVVFDSLAGNAMAGAEEAGAPTSMSHCYARNMTAQTTTLIDVAMPGAAVPFPDQECEHPLISGNGRYVIFYSGADNLVAGDTNTIPDIFVRDLVAGTTERVDLTPTGGQIVGPNTVPCLYPDYGISDDGTYVVLGDRSKQMVANDTSVANREIVLVNRVTHVNARVSFNSDGTQLSGVEGASTPGVSGDGTVVFFGATDYPSGTDGGVIYDEQILGVPRTLAH